MEESDGRVSITLKDVYQQTQSLEKSLGDSLATLNLTMVSIKSHLETLDSRNSAADELHREHSDRIRKLEIITDAANSKVTHADYEVRLRGLERFKYTLFGAIIIVNGAIGFIEYLLAHKGH